MGNTDSQKINTLPYPLTFAELRPVNVLKTAAGTLRVYQSNKTNKLFVEKSLAFDNSETYAGIAKCLEDLRQAENVAYLKVRAVEVQDRRMYCSSSSVKLVLDYFDKTLEDVLKAQKTPEFFKSEAAAWRLLFSLVGVLNFNQSHKIESHFVHPRAVYYDRAKENWGLLHPSLFTENNFSEALAGNLHFCSPELYLQIFSQNKRFLIVEVEKSNMFSLAVMVVYTLFSLGGELDMARIYNRQSISVDGAQLRASVEELENHGYSALLVAVLLDMLQEFEHLRLSPRRFLDLLTHCQEDLEAESFRGHTQAFGLYNSSRGSQDNLSFNNKMSHAFGAERRDHSAHISENFLDEDTIHNLRNKTTPFNPNFMEEDDSI